MTPVSPQASTLTNGIAECLRKRAEAITQEWSLRLDSAKAAFHAELAWQQAQAKTTPAPELPEAPAFVAGLLVELSSHEIQRLQPGLNEFGALCLKVEAGQATLMDTGQRQTRTLCSGETFDMADRRYQLKLFSFRREER